MPEEKVTESGVKYTDYHADTPASMKNEKRALLAMMAEHGTEGQLEYEKARKRAKELRANSIETAAARGQQIHAPGTLATELGQDYNALLGGADDALAQSLVGHGREMDRLSAANAAYLDQVAGASQLNRDLLDKELNASGLAGRGGGGGGGRGGGGRGGGGRKGYSPGDFDPSQLGQKANSLEEAGQAAGMGRPRGDAPSGTASLFGDETNQGNTGGDRRAKAILQALADFQQRGADPRQMRDAMIEMLEESGMNPWEKDAAATTLHNYFGFGPTSELGDYYSQANPEVSRFTEQGAEYMLEQERKRMANQSAARRAIAPKKTRNAARPKPRQPGSYKDTRSSTRSQAAAVARRRRSSRAKTSGPR